MNGILHIDANSTEEKSITGVDTRRKTRGTAVTVDRYLLGAGGISRGKGY